MNRYPMFFHKLSSSTNSKRVCQTSKDLSSIIANYYVCSVHYMDRNLPHFRPLHADYKFCPYFLQSLVKRIKMIFFFFQKLNFLSHSPSFYALIRDVRFYWLLPEMELQLFVLSQTITNLLDKLNNTYLISLFHCHGAAKTCSVNIHNKRPNSPIC